MYKRMITFVLCLSLLMMLSAQAGQPVDRLQYSLQLLEAVQKGDEAAVLQDMTAEMVAALKGKVAVLWPQLVATAGEFVEVAGQREYEQDGFNIAETGLQFERMYLAQSLAFDQQGKVSGLYYQPGVRPQPSQAPQADALPQGLTEEAVTIAADARYPLPGTLTLPEGEVRGGFVLVHGSGPNDRDERVGANKPFRDIAWGLARQGFAVLRYDKRTLVHGKEMAADPDFAKLTVEEETTRDAAQAVKVLLQRPEMAGKKAFLLGHSMGAMLASSVGTLAPEIAGYVLMAGTPRKLWQVLEDQNNQALAELPPEQAAQARPLLDAEIAKAKVLRDLTDEEALLPENAPFTISAWYLRHWEGIDAAGLHLQDGKPVLVLQGESDRQVGMADYALWQQALAEHPDAAFKSYPGLNHLFGRYEGEPVPLSQLVAVEYMQPTPVADEVIQDIARWALDRL